MTLFPNPALNGHECLPEKKYKCKKCKDMGWILYDREEGNHKNTKGENLKLLYTYGTPCECREGEIVSSLKNSSGITKEFLEKTFTSFKTIDLDPVIGEIRDIAVNYYTSFKKIEKTQKNSIALLGQPGIGKSHLLMALCNNMMTKKQKTVKYFPYVEGFDELRADLDNLENHLTKLKHIDILFIDDLFKPVTKQTKDGQRIKVPSASEWEMKQIYSVVNFRYLNYKPIFISSELSFPEILELDEALGSRIFEMCKDFNIYVPNNKNLNYRLKK